VKRYFYHKKYTSYAYIKLVNEGKEKHVYTASCILYLHLLIAREIKYAAYRVADFFTTNYFHQIIYNYLNSS